MVNIDQTISSSAPLITAGDCDTFIGIYRLDAILLVIVGVIFELFTAVFLYYAAAIRNDKLQLMAGTAILVTGLMPFKMSYARFYRWRFLQGVRVSLASQPRLSPFMQSQILSMMPRAGQ